MKENAGDMTILHICTKNHNHMRYGSWDTQWNKHRHFEPFLPFYPFNNPENQNFEKMKNVSGDVIILQMCDKNHSHMMYAFQDMECNRQIFLSFWAIFSQFISLTTWKIKIFKKWKKVTVFWDMGRQTGRVFFSFWTIFFPFTNRTTPPPATLQRPKKAKFWKNEKHLEISSFYTSVTKSWSYAILFLRYGVWRM